MEVFCNGGSQVLAVPVLCIPHPQGLIPSSFQVGGALPSLSPSPPLPSPLPVHFFISSSIEPPKYSSLTSRTSDRESLVGLPPPHPPLPLPQERNLSLFSQSQDCFQIDA